MSGSIPPCTVLLTHGPRGGGWRLAAVDCCVRELDCCPRWARAGEGVGTAVAAVQRGDVTLAAFSDPSSLQASDVNDGYAERMGHSLSARE